ncbi:outer membrane beta-barrel protein [Olivibacter sp. XZL3]|uniref:outer membrane beta-barrel protein n=1 Tax=Olivibacter sp. XZL3 TaxID=1735116 RepID=UPI001066ED16|nr:outer membrane beta-barrel protein [Olivibacter sp. XZL3]
MKAKFTTMMIIFTLITLSLNAQEPKRRGYIGISLGPSFPMGEFKNEGMANTGLNLSLINFGYFFSEHVGIAANWYGGAHNIDVSYLGLSDGMWYYGGLLAGPLFSIPISEKVDFDSRLQIGYSVANMKLEGYKVDGTGFAYNVGIGIRTHLAEKWSLSFNVDMLSANNKGDYMDRKIQTIQPTVGLSYRLR